MWLLWALDHRLSTAVWVGFIALVGLAAQTGIVRLDARNASFVIGSDVLGPMGRVLVPFATPEAGRSASGPPRRVEVRGGQAPARGSLYTLIE